MKKFLILLAIIFTIILFLPIIGNKIVDDILKDRIELVESYGVEVSKSSSDSSYLSTRRHYEFLLKDTDKIIIYLEQFSEKKLPPYAHFLLEDAVVGVDLKYSNFPLSEDVSTDIYLISLPMKMREKIENGENMFYSYLKNLTDSKSLLFHIDYKIVNSSFDGYIKDIKDEYISKDNTKIVLNIKDAIFNGTGLIIAPESFNSSVDKLYLSVRDQEDELKIKIDNLFSSTVLESQTTYVSTLKLDSIEYITKTDFDLNSSLSATELYVNISSNTQKQKAELYNKTSFRELKLDYNNTAIKIKEFNLDVAVNELDKDSYEEFRSALSKAKVDDTNEIKDTLFRLLSKGVVLSVADFSINKIDLDRSWIIDGFSVKLNADHEATANVTKGVQSSIPNFSDNLKLDAKFKFSKDIFEILNQEFPMSILAAGYAKEEANNLLFDIKFENTKLIINGVKLN